jgi:hypothetical protein
MGDLWADSIPYLVIRNKPRYLYDTIASQVKMGNQTLSGMRESAWQQAQYYKEFLQEPVESIPSYVLNDLLMQDMLENDMYLAPMKKRQLDGRMIYGMPAHRLSTSSICSFEHESQSFVAYASGLNLNEIIIRTPYSCLFDPMKNPDVSGR